MRYLDGIKNIAKYLDDKVILPLNNRLKNLDWKRKLIVYTTPLAIGLAGFYGVKDRIWYLVSPYIGECSLATNVEIGEPRIVTHQISSGETLTGITNRYGSTIGLIADTNDIENIDLIITGDKLTIPIPPFIDYERVSSQTLDKFCPQIRRYFPRDTFFNGAMIGDVDNDKKLDIAIISAQLAYHSPPTVDSMITIMPYEDILGPVTDEKIETMKNESETIELQSTVVADLHIKDMDGDGDGELLIDSHLYTSEFPSALDIFGFNGESFERMRSQIVAQGPGIKVEDVNNNGYPDIIVPKHVRFPSDPNDCNECPHPVSLLRLEWDIYNDDFRLTTDIPPEVVLSYAIDYVKSVNSEYTDPSIRYSQIEKARPYFGNNIEYTLNILQKEDELFTILYNQSKNPEALRLMTAILRSDEDYVTSAALEYILKDTAFYDRETGEIRFFASIQKEYERKKRLQGFSTREPHPIAHIFVDYIVFQYSPIPLGESDKEFLAQVVTDAGYETIDVVLDPLSDGRWIDRRTGIIIGLTEARTNQILRAYNAVKEENLEEVFALTNEIYQEVDRMEIARRIQELKQIGQATDELELFSRTLTFVAHAQGLGLDSNEIERLLRESRSEVRDLTTNYNQFVQNLDQNLNRYVERGREIYQTGREVYGEATDIYETTRDQFEETTDQLRETTEQLRETTEGYIDRAEETLQNLSDWLDNLSDD